MEYMVVCKNLKDRDRKFRDISNFIMEFCDKSFIRHFPVHRKFDIHGKNFFVNFHYISATDERLMKHAKRYNISCLNPEDVIGKLKELGVVKDGRSQELSDV